MNKYVTTYKHRDDIAEADSLILHVGTNNLEKESIGEISTKGRKLCDTVKARTPRQCEVALSPLKMHMDNPTLTSSEGRASQPDSFYNL